MQCLMQFLLTWSMYSGIGRRLPAPPAVVRTREALLEIHLPLSHLVQARLSADSLTSPLMRTLACQPLTTLK